MTCPCALSQKNGCGFGCLRDDVASLGSAIYDRVSINKGLALIVHRDGFRCVADHAADAARGFFAVRVHRPAPSTGEPIRCLLIRTYPPLA